MKIENSKNLWSKILNFLIEDDKNFKPSESILKNKLNIVDNEIFIYSKQSDIEILKAKQEKIKDFIKLETKQNFLLFIELNNLDLREQIKRENKEFLEKNKIENFVIHSNNKMLFQTLEKNIFINDEINTIFLCGGVGIGKTHLMGAAINFYEKTFRNKSFACLNLFDFFNKYYDFQKTLNSKKRLINVLSNHDLIVFDDFHLIKNRKNINKLIHFICFELIKLNKKIVFISRSKKNIFNGIDKNLIELIEKGYIFKLNEPNFDDVKSIIGKFIVNYNNNSLKISNEALEYLCVILGNNINIILDRMLKILLFFENNHTTKIINIANLKTILKKISFFKNSKNLINHSNNQQLKAICKKMKFDMNEILSTSRKKKNVLNRNIIIYIFKKKFNFSHEYIGKIVNKNHSTITHSLQIIEKKLKQKDFKNYFECLIEKIF